MQANTKGILCSCYFFASMAIPYEVVFKYLHCKEYPGDNTETRKEPSEINARNSALERELFFYLSSRRWINSKTEQEHILHSCHADKLGGHLGRDKTREKVTARFIRMCMKL